MIVPMEQAHVPEIAALERLCFSCPWDEAALNSECINPLSLWLAAIEDGQVVGYVGSQTVLPEADVMNLAVLPEYRKQRLGQQLMEELIARLRAKGVESLFLEVRVSNTPAINLYTKLGFTEVGRRKKYYVNPQEDALILRKELPC